MCLQPGGDCSLLAPKENQKGRRCPEGMKAPVGLLSCRPVCEANAACLARQGHGDFDALDPRIKGCSPLIIPKERSKRKNASRFAKTGCGAQRPLRALSGTRVLLTAAPTAPPCIRRWRRSSPLHFFLASPIDRPLSRCGGSSPQGSQRLQLPFAVTTPSREKENLKNPQIFQILKIKITFPLKMPRVKRGHFKSSGG